MNNKITDNIITHQEESLKDMAEKCIIDTIKNAEKRIANGESYLDIVELKQKLNIQ